MAEVPAAQQGGTNAAAQFYTSAASRAAAQTAAAAAATKAANDTAWYTAVAANQAAAATKQQEYTNTIDEAQATGTLDAPAELQQYGFSAKDAASLTSWYNGEIANQVDPATIQAQLYQRPEWVARFPAMDAMIKAGLTPWSPTDYMTVENAVQGLEKTAGLPAGFITPDDITKMAVNGIPVSGSTDSVEARISDALNAATTMTPQQTALLSQWYPGTADTPGGIASYFLNSKTALPLLENQATAANIGGSAEKAGFTSLDKNQLLSYVNGNGLTTSAAQSGIQQGATLLPLATPQGQGEGETVTQSQILGDTLGGEAASTQAVHGAESARGSKFAGGGGFGTTGGGAGAASE